MCYKAYTVNITAYTPMPEKTVILSFRVSPKLKRKLELRASNEQKNLTEFVRELLSKSEGEKVLESAKQELTELEVNARDMSERVTALNAQYVEMMETVAIRQKTLLDDAESRRKRLKRDRIFDSLIMLIFCFLGAVLGSAVWWAMETYSGS